MSTALPTAPACALPDTPLAAAKPGIDACVHCGFCLQACPTYVNLQDENDSPRGRILLMRSLLDGTLAPDDADVQLHIDRCLGCRACETACPSGVPYGRLIESVRPLVEARRSVGARRRSRGCRAGPGRSRRARSARCDRSRSRPTSTSGR